MNGVAQWAGGSTDQEPCRVSGGTGLQRRMARARRLLCFYKTEMTPCTGIAERAKEREIEGQSERSRVL